MGNYGLTGWIHLWRNEMVRNPFYTAEPFDRWHAWQDLCMMAEDEETVKTSLEALKTRWFWGSTKKVRKYLETVKETGMATVYFVPNKGTLIRINKGFFANKKPGKNRSKETVKETVKEIEEDTSYKEVGTASESRRPTSNKINKKSFDELNTEIGDSDEYEL